MDAQFFDGAAELSMPANSNSPDNLTALNIDLNARAENLSIADYARLANWLADNPPAEVSKEDVVDSEE